MLARSWQLPWTPSVHSAYYAPALLGASAANAPAKVRYWAFQRYVRRGLLRIFGKIGTTGL
jgi:hypothetical protein